MEGKSEGKKHKQVNNHVTQTQLQHRRPAYHILDFHWISNGLLLHVFRVSIESPLDLCWDSLGSLLDIYWISVGCLLNNYPLDLYWVSIGCLLYLY